MYRIKLTNEFWCMRSNMHELLAVCMMAIAYRTGFVMKRVKCACKALFIMLWVFLSNISMADQVYCDLNLKNHYGPFNYYDSTAARDHAVELVTKAHLTREMLLLQRGKSTTIAGDLDYTLSVIPNYPQALDLASRLERAVKAGIRPPKDKILRKVDCYFQRAVFLAPNINETYYLWGIHYHRNDQYQEALEKYAKAEQLGLSSPEFYYNMGLLYVDLEDYEKAVEYAEKVYDFDYPLQGLRSKLKKRGVW